MPGDKLCSSRKLWSVAKWSEEAMLQRLTGLGVGKTSSLIQWIADGSLSLEKPVDEVVLVYSQAQPLYMELAAAVAVVKLVRLEDSLSLEDFLRLVGTDRRPVRALIFDDVPNLFIFISTPSFCHLPGGGGEQVGDLENLARVIHSSCSSPQLLCLFYHSSALRRAKRVPSRAAV